MSFSFPIFHLEKNLCICFLGPRNQGLIKKDQLDVSHTGKPYSRHPCDPTVKVYFTFDHLHCYKNCASHIRDKIVKLPDGQLFSIADFQEAIDERGFFEISKGGHLKQKALDAQGQERQRVSHAVNMLNNETADMIEAQNPGDNRKLAIAKCLRALHNGHLVLTSNRWEANEENKLHSPLGKFTVFENHPKCRI